MGHYGDHRDAQARREAEQDRRQRDAIIAKSKDEIGAADPALLASAMRELYAHEQMQINGKREPLLLLLLQQAQLIEKLDRRISALEGSAGADGS